MDASGEKGWRQGKLTRGPKGLSSEMFNEYVPIYISRVPACLRNTQAADIVACQRLIQ
jgi:hypothetical protein